MKRLILLFLFLVFSFPASAEVLRGSASFDSIPVGFFGTWHVVSKMESSNKPTMFNPLSVDIWNLSGQGNVLVLENKMSGATSSIQVQPNKGSYDGKTLKFERIKETVEGRYKTIERESPEFVLDGNIFRGFDTMIIETYKDNKLVSRNEVRYAVLGQKISGESRVNE